MRRRRRVNDAIRETIEHGYGKFDTVGQSILEEKLTDLRDLPISTLKQAKSVVSKIGEIDRSGMDRVAIDFLDTLATVVMGGPTYLGNKLGTADY